MITPMKLSLFPTLKNYKKEYLPRDLFSGIIIAAVSIPISMGYAQIAGLPAVYGLYGSLLPILFFALFSTSKQFIFGVDAAPAAIVGAALSTLGISFESSAAMEYVPAIALFAGFWLLLFYFLHADRIVDFISTPVMGGFISGIRDHYPYADSKASGKSCWDRRTCRTSPPSGRGFCTYQLAISAPGPFVSDGTAPGKKIHSQISYGYSGYGRRSCPHWYFPCTGLRSGSSGSG